MPPKKKNFYALAKEKSVQKVEKKVASKQEAEPFKAGKNVYSVDGINVLRPEGMMPTWVQEGERWHINLRGGEENVYHVTREGSPKVQYFFQGAGEDIEGVQPSASERGSRSVQGGVHTKKSFDDLPKKVQEFIRDNWADILG